MDLYAAMQYLTTAFCCAAMLAVLAPLADHPPRARPAGLGDPRAFAGVCAHLR